MDFIEPSSPVVMPVPPLGDGWLHEPELDGLRLQIHNDGQGVRLYSKDGRLLNERFRSLLGPLSDLPRCVIDAGLVALDAKSMPCFSTLMRKPRAFTIWAFDLMACGAADLRWRPLAERRAKLSHVVRLVAHPVIRTTETFEDPLALLKAADDLGFEGVVSKRLGRPYRSGCNPDWIMVRTKSWLAAHTI